MGTTTIPATPAGASASRWPYLALFLLASLPFFWNLATDRYFAADGAGYFHDLLNVRWFMDFAYARNHAAYLAQWPLVLALRQGVTDLSTLKLLYGLGLYLPCLLGFLCCLPAVAPRHRPLLLLPVFSLLSITLASDGIMSGEHHVLVYFAWPILFLLVPIRPHTLGSGLLLGILLIIHSRLYESAMATGSIFSALLAIRLFVHHSWRQRLPNLLFLLLALTAVGIAVHSVLVPRDPANRSYFLKSTLEAFANPVFLATAAFIIPALCGLITENLKPMRIGLLVYTSLAAIWILTNQPNPVSISFSSRTLSLVFLPILMCCAILLAVRQSPLRKPEWRIIATFVLLATTSHLIASRKWLAFRREFREALRSHEGFLPVEQTKLRHNSQSWDWTFPLLSYYWSEGPVQTIILNPVEGEWQPFPPRTTPILPRYLGPPPDFLESR